MAPAPSGPAPPQAQATKKPLADTRRFGQAKATKKPHADTRRFGQAKATKDRRSPLGGHTAPGRLARPRPKRPGPVCPPRHSEDLALLEINKANPVISFVGNQQSLYVRPPRHTEARRRRLVRGPWVRPPAASAGCATLVEITVERLCRYQPPAGCVSTPALVGVAVGAGAVLVPPSCIRNKSRLVSPIRSCTTA